MRKWLLVGIVILGFLLRVFALDKFPSGFTPDEASFGYDAYSIMKTGKDQWGNSFPLVLKSFGDYKTPLYSYLDIPFVAVMGLNKVSVRLPNAILGTLAIFAIYLLVKELFKEHLSDNLPLIASFLLAISPWHIMMSRGAFEANLTTFFLPLGLYFLIRGLQKSNFLYLGATILGLNLFSYHSAKIVTPLIILAFVFFYRQSLFKIKKVKLLITALILVVFGLLTAYTFIIGAGTRVKDVSIFNGSLEEAFNERQSSVLSGENEFIAKLIHNKYTVDVKRFVTNYTSYFSPSFLFVKGPAEYTYGMLPGEGVLYWFELPLLILFFVSLVKTKRRREYLLLLIWIFLAPIPAALATGPGFAGNRAVIIIPAIQIALGIGAFEGLKYTKNKYILSVFSLFVLICFVGFLENYFVTSPSVASKGMLYGDLEVTTWLKENLPQGTKVIIDKDLSEPHIYVAFAEKWNPIDYQKESKNWILGNGINWVDQIPDYKLGNYEFKKVHIKEYVNEKDIYLVGKKDDFPPTTVPIKTIYYPNGDIAVEVVLFMILKIR